MMHSVILHYVDRSLFISLSVMIWSAMFRSVNSALSDVSVDFEANIKINFTPVLILYIIN